MFSINWEEVFLGAPYKLGDICKIYQLTLSEIVLQEHSIGMDKYYYYINLLTMEKEDLEEMAKQKGLEANSDLFKDLSVFDYLMLSAANDRNFLLDLKTALSTFIKEEILISSKNKIIIVGDPKERRFIKEEGFNELANVLRAFNKMRIKQPPPKNETPMQRRFREKRELRERTKEKQAQKSEDNIRFLDLMSSLCTMGIGINVSNIKDLTIFQIKDQLERAQIRERYYTELDMLMAGADSKKIKPEHYVRNLQKEVN